MIYANNIRQYRRRFFLRTQELAQVIGRSRGTLGTWEHSRCNPRLESALAVAAAIECPVEVLFLEQYQHIRRVVRRRMAKLPAKRYPDFRSCPVMWGPQHLRLRK